MLCSPNVGPMKNLIPDLLWLANIAAQFTILGFLIRRNAKGDYPAFFRFVLFSAVSSSVLFCIYHVGPQTYTYFYAYWTKSAVVAFLSLAVLHEIFCTALRPLAGLQDLAKLAFRWAVLVAILIAGFMAAASAQNTAVWMVGAINNFERALRLMQCGLLLLVYFMLSRLGLSIRSRIFGFALGFGILATMNLFELALSGTSGTVYSHISNLVNFCVALGVYAMWAAYIALPEPARQAVQLPITSPLIRWNEAALALGRSGGQVALATDSAFMPNVERMVDEVMRKDMFVERRSRA